MISLNKCYRPSPELSIGTAAESYMDAFKLIHRPCCGNQMPRLDTKTVFLATGIPIIKMRRSDFIMGISILVRQHLHIDISPADKSSQWIREYSKYNDLRCMDTVWLSLKINKNMTTSKRKLLSNQYTLWDTNYGTMNYVREKLGERNPLVKWFIAFHESGALQWRQMSTKVPQINRG